MAKFVRFIADMLEETPQESLRNVHERFARDPEDVMKSYDLTEEQKEAVRSRDSGKIAEALTKELHKVGGGGGKPNW